MTPADATPAAYSYLGPAGTFTEAALAQVAAAAGAPWRAVNNIGEALADVLSGRSVAAMMAIENTVEGGVAAVLDVLATTPDLRIVGEYLVPVRFALAARPGVSLSAVQSVLAHPVAYAQCRTWLHERLPSHTHTAASSNIQAAQALAGGGASVGGVAADGAAVDGAAVDGAVVDGAVVDGAVADGAVADAAIVPLGSAARFGLETLADDIGDNPGAVTRFVLVALARSVPLPDATGADKTSIVADLPSDRPGVLLELLEQFATRGVNLSLLHSRPIGDELGRYRFVIDLDGHIDDERIAEAVIGVRRFSPRVLFLGSYPRADRRRVTVAESHHDAVYAEARAWLRDVLDGGPPAR